MTPLEEANAAVRRRLVPFLFLLYIVAYLDRINVGFAALQMNQALGFSATTYGIGAGVFFLSYVVFEIPSNVILARVGARIWIARIMISWGVVSSATLFVRGAAGFYTLRFLLGAGEAGFFPGLIFYLTRWCPARERARTIAAFMTATLAAGIVGGPISGALLSLHGAAGLAGWQWLFLLEGLPAIALGIVVLWWLPERPDDARWLREPARTALVERLREEAGPPEAAATIRAALVSGAVWRLAIVYFTIPVALYGLGFWLPQLLARASRASDFEVGLLSAIPYAAAVVGMIAVGRSSDRRGERRWHVAFAALAGGAGFAGCAAVHDAPATVAALSLAMLGLASMFGPFWALATSLVSGIGAAAGIALINAVGNIGGFVGPSLVGYLSDRTHSFALPLVIMGATLAAGGLLALTAREPTR